MATGDVQAGAAPLQVVIISPEETVYEGRADSVIAPAWDGQLGILRGHAPLMALLGTGELRVTQGSRTEAFQVAGGFLQVSENLVTVLTESSAA